MAAGSETLPLAVNLMPDGPAGRVAELARLAEDRGASRCLVYDEGLHTRDVYVTLSAVAAATTRMPIGPGITNPFVRHPGATASAIATLDELSGRRAFLGLGAGGGLTLGPLAIDRVRPVSTVVARDDGSVEVPLECPAGFGPVGWAAGSLVVTHHREGWLIDRVEPVVSGGG